jgi:hypothetical protein
MQQGLTKSSGMKISTHAEIKITVMIGVNVVGLSSRRGIIVGELEQLDLYFNSGAARNQNVTGPSLVRLTCMFAPKRPPATGRCNALAHANR